MIIDTFLGHSVSNIREVGIEGTDESVVSLTTKVGALASIREVGLYAGASVGGWYLNKVVYRPDEKSVTLSFTRKRQAPWPFGEQKGNSVMENNNNTESVWDVTKESAAIALRIAGSQVILTKLVEVFEKHLRQRGVDTTLLQDPMVQSLVKVALPTLLLTATQFEPVKNALGEGMHESLSEVAAGAQTAAMIEGSRSLIEALVPMLTDFVTSVKNEPKVSGLLNGGASSFSSCILQDDRAQV